MPTVKVCLKKLTVYRKCTEGIFKMKMTNPLIYMSYLTISMNVSGMREIVKQNELTCQKENLSYHFFSTNVIYPVPSR